MWLASDLEIWVHLGLLSDIWKHNHLPDIHRKMQLARSMDSSYDGSNELQHAVIEKGIDMASPKTYKRYASQWFRILDSFKEDPQKVREVTCPNKNKAMAMRLEFYKMREAFIKDPELRKEYEYVLNSREVHVTDDGRVVFDTKDNNWIGKLIDESLGGPEPRPNGEQA